MNEPVVKILVAQQRMRARPRSTSVHEQRLAAHGHLARHALPDRDALAVHDLGRESACRGEIQLLGSGARSMSEQRCACMSSPTSASSPSTSWRGSSVDGVEPRARARSGTACASSAAAPRCAGAARCAPARAARRRRPPAPRPRRRGGWRGALLPWPGPPRARAAISRSGESAAAPPVGVFRATASACSSAASASRTRRARAASRPRVCAPPRCAPPLGEAARTRARTAPRSARKRSDVRVPKILRGS